MKPDRPVVVLVFAILNLVFGGMSILGFLCGGMALAFLFAIFSSAPPSTPFPRLPSGLITLFVAIFIYGFIMAGVLTVSGVGLLNMRGWARKSSIAYAVITIVYSLLAVVLNITYIGPAMQEWQKDFQKEIARDAKLRGGTAPPQMYQPGQSPILNAASSVAGAVIGMAYAVALLVVMFLPQVSAAFAGRRVRQRMDWDQEPDDEFEEG